MSTQIKTGLSTFISRGSQPSTKRRGMLKDLARSDAKLFRYESRTAHELADDATCTFLPQIAEPFPPANSLLGSVPC